MRGSPSDQQTTIWRGVVADTPEDPFRRRSAALRVLHDGAVVAGPGGRILHVGPFEGAAAAYPTAHVDDRRPAWILPGFVDCHTHFPQTFAIASGGGDLLTWLHGHVFPEEIRLQDPTYATRVAAVYCDRLVRSGTTTALVFGSHDPQATALCLREARHRRLRVIAGKVLHGCDVPAPMLDGPDGGLDACRALVADWHGRDKVRIAVMPRFALTSTAQTYEACRALLRENPGLHVHTHVSESVREVAEVGVRFPDSTSYCDAYDREGLLGPNTILAHGVHLSVDERSRLARRGVALAHCPSSNAFLGSGIMSLREAIEAGIRVGLGTDVGAGTSFSVAEETRAAYGAASLRGRPLSAAEMLWLATQGGAQTLGLGDEVGSFAPGKAADFVILDPKSDLFLVDRLDRAPDAESKLFVLLFLAGAAAIGDVIIDGRSAIAEGSC